MSGTETIAQGGFSGDKPCTLLVLAPHPDDLELSAGLLSHRALEIGWKVVEIVLTDGAMGGVEPSEFGTRRHIERRAAEALSSAQLLGGVAVEFLNIPDGQLSAHSNKAVEFVRRRAEVLHPEIICFPSPLDRHVDHRATHLITIEALAAPSLQDAPIMLEYCYWGNDERKNIRIYHPSGRGAKLRAINEHRSQPVEYLLQVLNKREGPAAALAIECFHAPQPEAAFRFLLESGFDVQTSL